MRSPQLRVRDARHESRHGNDVVRLSAWAIREDRELSSLPLSLPITLTIRNGFNLFRYLQGKCLLQDSPIHM